MINNYKFKFYYFLILICLITFSQGLIAQNAYYDALKIEYIVKYHLKNYEDQINNVKKEIIESNDSIFQKSDRISKLILIKNKDKKNFKTKDIKLIKVELDNEIGSSKDINSILSNLNKKLRVKELPVKEIKNLVLEIENSKELNKIHIKLNRELPVNEIKKFKVDPFKNSLSPHNLEAIRNFVAMDEYGIFGINNKMEYKCEQSIEFFPSTSINVTTQSAIIDGTAKFLAERFKEDVTALYVNNFRKKLNNFNDFSALCPKTKSFLNSADIFNFRTLGNDFKDAFEYDLRNLLFNLQLYINDPAQGSLKTELVSKKFFQPLDFMLAFADKLLNGYHPVEIIEFLDDKYKGNRDFDEYYKIIHFLNIIQKPLQTLVIQGQEIKTKSFWKGIKEVSENLNGDALTDFIAFVSKEDPDFFSGNTNTPIGNSTAFKSKIIYPIVELLNNIENIRLKEKVTGDDYAELIENVLKLFKFVDGIAKSSISVNDINRTLLDGTSLGKLRVFDFIDKIMDVYKAIYKRNYGYVVTNSLFLVENIFIIGNQPKIKTLQLLNAISKYCGFMVDIVTTKDSEDVKEAIKRNVTKYTYLNKRNNIFNLTLSAHPGFYFGDERLISKTENAWRPSLGITAPIGFEIMWGIKKSTYSASKELYSYASDIKPISMSGNAWSVFVSLVDIGAAFNYRLNDSESELPESITFKQILSPGISLNYALRNTPITLGLGMQYTPELRKVTVGGVEKESNAVRVLLRIGWDIPLIKLWNKEL